MSDGEAHPLESPPTKPLQTIPISRGEPSQEIGPGSVHSAHFPFLEHQLQPSVELRLTLDIPNRFLSPPHSQNRVHPSRNAAGPDGDVVSNDAPERDFEDSIPGTPDIEQLMPDEPSSALADRIIRALDNPSPPPRFGALPYATDLPESGSNTPLPLIDISPSSTPQLHLTPLSNMITGPVGGEPIDGDSETVAAAVLGSALRQGSSLLYNNSPPSAPVACGSPQFDLISFDSFEVSPQPRFSKEDVPEAGPSTPKPFFPAKDTSTSVTDFLTSSPTPPRFAPQATIADYSGTAASLESILRIATPPKPWSVSPGSGTGNDEAQVGLFSADKQPLKQHKGETSGSVRDSVQASGPTIEFEKFESDSEDFQNQSLPTLRRSPRRSVNPQFTVPFGSPVQLAGKSQTMKEGTLPPLVEKEFRGVSDQDQNGEPFAEDTFVKPEESGKIEDTRHDGIKREDPRKIPEAAWEKIPITSLQKDDTTATSLSPFTHPLLVPPNPLSTGIFSSKPSSDLHTPGRVLASPYRSGSDANIMHSPARRVLLMPTSTKSAQQGQKPVEGISTPMSRANALTKLDLDDPMHSPRRVPVDQSFKFTVSSPQRQTRSASEEPRPGPSKSNSIRSSSAEPTASSVARRDERQDLLNMTPSTPRSHPNSFPAVDSAQPVITPRADDHTTKEGRGSRKNTIAKPTVIRASPQRSSLKQPSTRATSRIPRIGTKPYARPLTGKKEAKAAVITRRVADPATTSHEVSKAFRRTHSGRKAEGSSNDVITKSSNPPLLSNRGKSFPVKTTSSATNLKRKREAGTSTSKPRSLPTIRKVPADPVFSQAPAGPSPMQAEPSPQKPSVVIRRVPDIMVPKPVEIEARDAVSSDEGPRSPLLPPSRTQDDIEGDQAKATAEQVEIISPIPRLPILPSAPSQERDKLSMLLHSDDDMLGMAGLRRTTRPRKLPPPADVTVPSHSQAPPRRKATALTRSEAPAFSGMSAMALKALTSSNTVRNQQYLVAKLETEVVRVEGARPQSPGIKMRTVAQKQMEDKKKERQERAERRAKRGEEWQSDFEDFSFSKSEEDSVDGQNEEGQPLRHRRGAGEDDYDTPDQRPATFVGAVEEVGDKKRVKWDRGLSQIVNLEDVLPREKARPSNGFFKKGCLAPTAKTIRLDTLGNKIDADAPLGDLVHENIVIKKFVYDTDLEPHTRAKPRNKKVKG